MERLAIGPEINYFTIDGHPSPDKKFKGFVNVPHEYSELAKIRKVSDEAFFYQQEPSGPDNPYPPKLFRQS